MGTERVAEQVVGDGARSRADRFAPLTGPRAERWAAYGLWQEPYFMTHVGIRVEELRVDYCRMRLPWRQEMMQPAGVAHGGAIATIVDAVVVPAIGSGYDDPRSFVTVALNIQFMGALVDEDAIAEGWVTQRGRSIVFCEAEVVGASTGRRIARGVLTYKVSSKPAGTLSSGAPSPRQ